MESIHPNALESCEPIAGNERASIGNRQKLFGISLHLVKANRCSPKKWRTF